MGIEEQIKRWVTLDNQLKQLQSQIQALKDEKLDLTNSLITHFDSLDKKYPIININDGRLSFIQVKQPNALSYKFLEQCLIEYFSKNSNDTNSATVKLLLDYIKSKRTYTMNKTIKRVNN